MDSSFLIVIVIIGLITCWCCILPLIDCAVQVYHKFCCAPEHVITSADVCFDDDAVSSTDVENSGQRPREELPVEVAISIGEVYATDMRDLPHAELVLWRKRRAEEKGSENLDSDGEVEGKESKREYVEDQEGDREGEDHNDDDEQQRTAQVDSAIATELPVCSVQPMGSDQRRRGRRLQVLPRDGVWT
jgi:hypothetical protein